VFCFINGLLLMQNVIVFLQEQKIRFEQINQLDATISPVYYLTFISAHHVSGVLTPITRSSTAAVAASGFTLRAW
jgi:hypothetical protein